MQRVLLFMGCLTFVFLMLTMAKYLDDWLLASGRLSHFVWIMLCFVPTAIKTTLPLAAPIALIYTQRDFLDAYEWQAMQTQGLSRQKYIGWVMTTALLLVVVLNGAIKLSHSTMLTDRLVHMATKSLSVDGLRNIQPGSYKFLPKQHLLFYRDPVFKDRYIIATTAGQHGQQHLMIGHGKSGIGHLPNRLFDGKIYFMDARHPGFSIASFEHLSGFMPKGFDAWPHAMLKKLFGRIFATDYWSYSLFLLWMMLWATCCPWVCQALGRFKSILAIVGLYAMYLHLLKLATTPLWQGLLSASNRMILVHVCFYGCWAIWFNVVRHRRWS